MSKPIRIIASVGMAAWSLAACDGGTGLDLESPGLSIEVEGNARAALDETGHFQRSALAPTGAGLISHQRAREVAEAVVRTHITNPNLIPLEGLVPLEESLEKTHGRQIEWGEVSSSGDAFLFAHPVLNDPHPDLPLSLRDRLGPHWLIPLEWDGERVAVIAVAAGATDVFINPSGYLLSKTGRSYFEPLGIPRGEVHPTSPEFAVRHAFHLFGIPIVEVPRLIQPAQKITPALPFWELVLASSVEVREADSGEKRTTDTLYLHSIDITAPEWTTTVYVAAADQPEGETYRFKGQDYLVPRRPGAPIRFMRILQER